MNKRLLFVVLTMVFLLSPKVVFGAEEAIRVSSYNIGSVWLPLAPGPLSPPLSQSYANVLPASLKNINNFGPNGVVPCNIDTLNEVSSVLTGSLVDQDGNLLADVFFGGAKKTNLTDDEATELAKFVNAGGVLYITGAGWQDVNTPGQGPEYNLLFEKLGVVDRFSPNYSASGYYAQTSDPIDSVITRGPFGNVGPLSNDSFRIFNKQSLNGIASKVDTSEFEVHEKKIGKGYLIVTGNFIYSDFLLNLDADNLKYFLNLFALGCGQQDFGKYEKVVLDVPSFKQGLYPFDAIDPTWENLTYDDGDKQNLFCDTNSDGAKMYECGCAVTSASMVMRFNNVDKLWYGEDVTPQSVNDYFKDYSGWTGNYYKSYGYTGGNVNWQSVSTLTADANTVYTGQTKLDKPIREDFNVDKIEQYIDNGTPVIQQVTGNFGLHWVVVKGYEPSSNRLIINDPAYPDLVLGYSYLDEKYTPVQTKSMITYLPTHSDFRYLQFISPSPQNILITDSQGRKTGFNLATNSVLEQIPNSEYIFEGFYGDPSNDQNVSTQGMYFLNIYLPEDGEYHLNVLGADPKSITIYSSNVAGKQVSEFINPTTNSGYDFVYNQQTAGEKISLQVQINIDPILKQNIIIPHKLFSIPVAVLASDNFDVNKVNPKSLTFGKTGDEGSLISCLKNLLDVNRDRKKDLICYFRGDKTNLDTPDTQAMLKGDYERGISFEASDSVKVIKPWPFFR